MVSRDDELAQLRAENVRLVGLLETHGIAWRLLGACLAPACARTGFHRSAIDR